MQNAWNKQNPYEQKLVFVVRKCFYAMKNIFCMYQKNNVSIKSLLICIIYFWANGIGTSYLNFDSFEKTNQISTL